MTDDFRFYCVAKMALAATHTEVFIFIAFLNLLMWLRDSNAAIFGRVSSLKLLPKARHWLKWWRRGPLPREFRQEQSVLHTDLPMGESLFSENFSV